jgi:putative aldouronate transport system substrate-binding protein
MSKRKLNRREFLQLAATTAGASLLAACAPQATPEATAEPTAVVEPEATMAPAAGDCTMDWSPTFPPTPKEYDPPVECEVIYESAYEGPDGSGRFDNPMFNRTLEHTDVNYTLHWEGYSDVRTQKLSADIAAGTLPDQFHSTGLQFEQLIEEGMIMDIKDIWDATASDLVKEKKMYPDYKWWRPVLRGDQLWGIPFTWGPAYNVDNICFIRQDWLDELGIEAPKTVEDWGTTAAAFRDAGLCEFGISACRNLNTWYQSLDPIFGAYGVQPSGYWQPDGAGGLVYGGILPGNKEALAVIRGWYEEGLIDPDFFTYGEGDAAGHIAAEKIGIFTAPWWHGGGQANLERDNEGWKFAIFDYPTGPDGRQGRRGSGEVQTQVVFRSGLDPQVVEANINNLNWHVEMHVNWEKYQQYGEWRNSHAFVQGYEWEWDEDCELMEGPVANTYGYMNAIDFGFPYGIYPSYQYDIFVDMTKWTDMDESELNKAQRFLLSNPAVLKEMEYYPYVYDTLDTQIVNEYFGNPTDRMKELLPDMNTLESQVFIDIVIGNEDLDRFDEFVEEWKEMGGNEVTEDVNAWYDEVFG